VNPGSNPSSDPGLNPGSDPNLDPGSDPGSDPSSDPGPDPGFIISLSRQQAMSIHTGAVIYRGQFNISIGSLNQSHRPWPLQKLR